MINPGEGFLRLWTVILADSGMTHVELAKLTGVDDAVLSRISNGELPKGQEKILRIARACKAPEPVIRVLLTLHLAAVAAEDGNAELAHTYCGMFAPLFPRRAFIERLNPPETIAANILADLGLDLSEKYQFAINRAIGTGPPADVFPTFVKALKKDKDIKSLVDQAPCGQLEKLLETYSRIVAFDPEWKWMRLRHYGRSNFSKGKAVLTTIAKLPRVRISWVEMTPGSEISDGGHEGMEFVLIAKGAGAFSMDGLQQIQLDTKGRRFIAYIPESPHSFLAGAQGASLVVVEYLQALANEEDVISRVIQLVERHTPGWCPRRKNTQLAKKKLIVARWNPRQPPPK